MRLRCRDEWVRSGGGAGATPGDLGHDLVEQEQDPFAVSAFGAEKGRTQFLGAGRLLHRADVLSAQLEDRGLAWPEARQSVGRRVRRVFVPREERGAGFVRVRRGAWNDRQSADRDSQNCGRFVAMLKILHAGVLRSNKPVIAPCGSTETTQVSVSFGKRT